MVPLRSNFLVGSTKWAVRRTQWRSMGLTDEDMMRPKVAVINSSSSLSSCYTHLDQLSRIVQDSIRSAGGLPFEVRTIAPSDFVTSAGREGRYLMPSRDLVVNDIEAMVEGAMLDAMVCLASCDKTTPAHLMAAGRLDLPTVVVIGGYQPSGQCGGSVVDIDDVYETVGAVATGRSDLGRLREMSDVAISGPGVCSGLGTANSMHIMAEALGMTVADSAPVLAGSGKMAQMAAAAGRCVVESIEHGRTARQIITERSLRNAVTVAVATGCSVNVVRHLSAVAFEAEVDVDVIGMFEEAASAVPLMCGVRPNGPRRIEDLEAAGGARAIMSEVASLLHLDALTVTGESIAERVVGRGPIDHAVICTLDQPYSSSGGLAILRGTLAPAGSIVKRSAVPDELNWFQGPARVFPGEATAMQALTEGAIHAGDVVVLRGLGPLGGPGTVFAAGFVAALVGAGMSDRVAVVTDGELSGLNRGLTVGQVMPEAAAGGPLAIVRDGDVITIDLRRSRLDLDLDADEINRRIGQLDSSLGEPPRGWLGIYRSLVRPMEQGAPVAPRTESAP